MKPRHAKYSQHFLNSPKIAQRIVAQADIAGEFVIEVGAGKGALTIALAERAQRVIAVEIDRRLIEGLRNISLPNVTIIHADFLEYNIVQHGTVIIVGTIPYALSSLIIEKCVTSHAHVKRAVVVVQREFAHRLVAQPGMRKYGYITVAVNSAFTVEKLFNISSRFFTPAPRVSSVVLRLERKELSFRIPDEKAFLDFVKKVFAYSRKSTRNAILRATGTAISRPDDERLLRRPATLSLKDFFELHNILKTYSD
jgi:16S rRNA (adenine1518-N6/adenine1519-N6)-dimethyltransferase